MANKKETRKELLKEPDKLLVFIQGVSRWSLEHRNMILLAIVALLVAVGGFSAARYVSHKNEAASFALLDKGMTAFEEAMGKDENPKAAYESVAENFSTLLTRYGNNGGGRLGRIAYANMALEAGDVEKAVTLYREALDHVGDQPELKNLALNGLGHALESKGDMAGAIQRFEAIANGSDTLLKMEAWTQLGRLYARTGEKEKSKNAYEKSLGEGEGNPYADMIRDRLANG